MRSEVPGHRLTAEVVVWLAAATAAYATFTSFEPFYERLRGFAVEQGYDNASLFPKPQTAVEVRKPAAAAQGGIRGSIGDAPPPPKPKIQARRVTLAANSYGHFHAQTTVNGREVEFLTDTGATYVALTYETALKIGLIPSNLHFTGRSTTANGIARVASVTLETVRIEGITMRDVQAVVAEPGKMSQNLLGMSFIGRLSGFELAGTKLVMIE